MCKSLDSSAVERSLLSIYQEQGRQNRQLNTPSKIYTPNGTFEGSYLLRTITTTYTNNVRCRNVTSLYVLTYGGSLIDSPFVFFLFFPQFQWMLWNFYIFDFFMICNYYRKNFVVTLSALF